MVLRGALLPLLLGVYLLLSAPPVSSTVLPAERHLPGLWEEPKNLAARDLYNGPWGSTRAPDPHAVYTFVRPKQGGTNPGVVVRDPSGREWHVKQPKPGNQGDEGPSELVLSRVLSALGYHQPPVYYLRSFTMATGSKTAVEPGGRFRLHGSEMKDSGSWSWQENPFVDTRPYKGLLVIMLMFNSSDLKNSNNTMYDVTTHTGVQRWYVVRDLGSALGKTSRFRPIRNTLERFEQTSFIRDVKDGFVEFDYHGDHQELVRRRITPADVAWAADLASGLSLHQWQDAFRAGGYSQDVATRYIDLLRGRIAQAKRIGAQDASSAGGQ